MLLAIGFASISTTLVLNGTIGIGVNIDDFDVYFSEAILEGEDVSSDVISSDGKNIDFATRRLTIEGERSSLIYKVKNASTQYDAEVSVECALSNQNEEVNMNDYIEFTNSMTSELIRAGQEEQGILKVKLKKASVEELQTSLNCKLIVNATEKTDSDEDQEGSLANKTYSFSGVLLDESGNPLANKTLVIYPEPVIYVTTDENGYVNIPELSKNHTDIYILDENISLDELKQMPKKK